MTRTMHFAAAAAFTVAMAGTGLAAFAQKHNAPPHPRITASQARAIALKKVKGRVVGKIALENEAGKWEYAVSIQEGKALHEVMVNAQTGKIESVEATTAAEEAAEARAEKAAARHTHHNTGKHQQTNRKGEDHEEHGKGDRD